MRTPPTLLFSLILLLICTGFARPAQAATPEPPPAVTVQVSLAKLRAGPGSAYPSLGSAQQGAVLSVYGASPDSAWLLVATDPQAWVAAVQVSPASFLPAVIPTVAVPVSAPVSRIPLPTPPPATAPSNVTSLPSAGAAGAGLPSLALPANPPQAFRNLLPFALPPAPPLRLPLPAALFGPDASLNLGSAYTLLTAALLIWGCALLVPLLALRWRWFFGSLVFSLLFGPLGALISVVIALKILAGSNTIANSSPRDLLEDFAGSPPVLVFLFLLFVLLTAVSILGGVIFFAILYLSYQFVRLLLPGLPAGHPRFTSASSAYLSSTSSSSGDDDSRSYDDPYPYDPHDYDDHDADNQPKGSLWDGWLVKW